MTFSKRQVNDAVCYTKPLDSLKSWNDHFFWVDSFACPASFLWNTSKSVSKDPFPRSYEFNTDDYATLVAYPALFHKYPEPFLCLVEISQMDLLSFIQTTDPTKVRVGERQYAEDEPRLLDTIVGRVVPLLPIAPARAESELDASVDKLFDEGVSEAAETVVEDAAPVQPRRQRKRKTIVYDVGEPLHPLKKLREDHGTLSGASIGGKSISVVQRLLVRAMQNAEVRSEAIPTLPFVTSSVSAMLEYSSHHSGANIAEAEVDSFARPSIPLMTVATIVTSKVDLATTVKEKFVKSYVFGGDSSGGGSDHTACGFSDLTSSDFIVGGIRTVISPNTDLQKVHVSQWSITNGSRLDDGRTCRKMVDEFAPPKFFASIRGIEHDQLFMKFNVGDARQMSLSAEKNSLPKAKDEEVTSLKAQLLVMEAEATEVVHLQKTDLSVKVADLAASVKVREQEVADLDAQVQELEASFAGLQEKVTSYEGFIDQLEKFQDEKIKEVNEKCDKLCADFVEMTLHLEEKFYLRLLTTISKSWWLLTHSMELAIAKCLNSTEYLSILGAAIGKAVKKGMQKGYLLELPTSVNFSLIVELRANKDASIDTIMNLLRMEDTLDER
ncbi:hypothetical protein Tco_0276720, partial [Tanacetum coccineum]